MIMRTPVRSVRRFGHVNGQTMSTRWVSMRCQFVSGLEAFTLRRLASRWANVVDV